MSNNKKAGPRMFKVSPNVTDPSMQSKVQKMTKSPDAEPQDEFETDELNLLFDNPSKTKEEDSCNNKSTNKLLLIIFALVVIALVAIIIWMVLKQGNDKEAEEELVNALLEIIAKYGKKKDEE